MTIDDLRKLIADLPGGMLVMRSGSDHSFVPVYAEIVTVVREHRNYWGEDGGQDGQRVDVLVMGR